MKNLNMLWSVVLMTGWAVNAGLCEPPATSSSPAGDDSARPAERQKCRGHLASELGLSQEKAAEIKNLMHETRKTMIKLKADRDLAKADLEHLLSADTLDEKAIMASADKLAKINADMTKAQVKARLAVSAALTPEQRARMQELRQGLRQKFKERGEERRGQGREPRGRGGEHSGDEPEAEGGGGGF